MRVHFLRARSFAEKIYALLIRLAGGSFAAPETGQPKLRNACGMHSKWNCERAGYPKKQSQKTSSQ
jgi:hypothetical protein